MEHLEQLTAAVERGRTGDRAAARHDLGSLWEESTDLQERCAIAHYLADLQDDVHAELRWDLRALECVQDDGWLPSLHLNLADDYRRLAQPGPANEHLEAARSRLSELPEGAYGEVIRAGVGHVADALKAGNVRPLESSPSS
ncbi:MULTISPECIES: hypothetical protein [Kribbella]|uniref:Tetratricopeptide repeat protein n=1 Tax=Kribbella karoonensis TaxID=324851 RepID=A0ABP4NNK7_9ACTN